MDSGKGYKKILYIVIIVLILSVLFFLKKDNQDKFINFIENIGMSDKEFDKVVTISTEGGLVGDFVFYDRGVLVWEGKNLSKFKMDGSKEWERVFDIDQMGLLFGEKNIYGYDKEKGEIHFLNSKGEIIKEVDLETNIKNIVEDSGKIIAHIENSEGEGIVILNKEGDIVEKNIVEASNILTYSSCKDDNRYALSILDLTEGKISSQVKAFEYGGKILFDSFVLNEIIVYSKFIEADKLLIMSDEGIYCLDDGEISWAKKFKGIKDIHVGEEKINILYGDRLEDMSFDGKTLGSRSFSERYNKVISYKKGLILYGNEDIMGLKEDKEIFKYKGEGEILKVDEGRGALIIDYKDRLDIISN